MNEARRLLDLVQQQLGAADARIELFGAPPQDDRLVAAPLGPDTRVVAVFETPVGERRDELHERLVRIVDGFAGTAADAVAAQLDDTPLAASTGADAELAEALDVLRSSAAARAVVIVDERSPEIWAASPVVPWRTVDDAAATRDPALGELAAAIAAVRSGDPPGDEVHVATLLGLYRLVVLGGEGGPLRVEGATRRARPVLERLLRSLPPRRPPPTRAAVVPLRG